ncbi:UbiA prenyltransferase family, partial [Stachybotrys elegans]
KLLSRQYGGIHAGSWVDLFPASLTPWIQLCRLSPPAAFFLIYFPHIFGAVYAAAIHELPLDQLQRVSLILFGGSFFCNNASHAWNDLIDAPIDAKIQRTRTRPIPRGAITPRAAFAFTVLQALLAALFLCWLPADTAVATVPTIIGTTYYPFAKRHTYFPQLILGFCLTWGVMVGSSAMGASQPWKDPATLSLLGASTLWVVIFDTIYAHQDLADDVEVGVKSMAVLFRGRMKLVLWVLYSAMVVCLTASGVWGGFGLAYGLASVGGCGVSVGCMIVMVDLEDPESCWLWFSQGFWLTGSAIITGLLAEYALCKL